MDSGGRTAWRWRSARTRNRVCTEDRRPPLGREKASDHGAEDRTRDGSPDESVEARIRCFRAPAALMFSDTKSDHARCQRAKRSDPKSVYDVSPASAPFDRG